MKKFVFWMQCVNAIYCSPWVQTRPRILDFDWDQAEKNIRKYTTWKIRSLFSTILISTYFISWLKQCQDHCRFHNKKTLSGKSGGMGLCLCSDILKSRLTKPSNRAELGKDYPNCFNYSCQSFASLITS